MRMPLLVEVVAAFGGGVLVAAPPVAEAGNLRRGTCVGCFHRATCVPTNIVSVYYLRIWLLLHPQDMEMEDIHEPEVAEVPAVPEPDDDGLALGTELLARPQPSH
ncbi:hypothetical protein EBR96_10715, partial [bacterium]|nr:hypothetical protein [bacterium]